MAELLKKLTIDGEGFQIFQNLYLIKLIFVFHQIISQKYF